LVLRGELLALFTEAGAQAGLPRRRQAGAGAPGQRSPGGICENVLVLTDVAPQDEAVRSVREDVQIAVGVDIANDGSRDLFSRKDERAAIVDVNADERAAVPELDEPHGRVVRAMMPACRRNGGPRRDERKQRRDERVKERAHQLRR
jgi:hypothetical protein